MNLQDPARVNARIETRVQELLTEDDLPASTMKRATAFIRAGDLETLVGLPLSPEDMICAGTVLLRAPVNGRIPAAGAPVPVLPPALRRRLRRLVDTGDAHADAALFILSRDLRARALNSALTEAS